MLGQYPDKLNKDLGTYMIKKIAVIGCSNRLGCGFFFAGTGNCVLHGLMRTVYLMSNHREKYLQGGLSMHMDKIH